MYDARKNDLQYNVLLHVILLLLLRYFDYLVYKNLIIIALNSFFFCAKSKIYIYEIYKMRLCVFWIKFYIL